MRVNFAGVSFKNPVVTASGTFGFGRDYGEFYDLSELGGICVKGLTLHPRLGNAPPRIAESAMGVLNSVGLQNPGVDAFIETDLKFLRQFDTVVIANISGNSADEYAQAAQKLSDADVDMLEVNVSCPNVKAGGLQFGTSPDLIAEVTLAVRRVSNVPVIVKLSPNVTDIVQMAKSAESAGADAVSLINTLLAMRIDINTERPVLYNNTGGLSGPAVFPVAVRMVHQVYNAVSIPILGMGGVTDGDTALEMMLAGASLVAVGTANFADPYASVKTIAGLKRHMISKNAESICDFIGRAKMN